MKSKPVAPQTITGAELEDVRRRLEHCWTAVDMCGARKQVRESIHRDLEEIARVLGVPYLGLAMLRRT